MGATPVMLVSTPWTTLRAPSIQIGTIKAVLDRAGVPAKTAHLYVTFFEYLKKQLGQEIPDIDEFESFGWLFGEWIFAVPPFRTQSEMNDERFRLQFRYQFGETAVNRAFAIRRLVPGFLENCADEILESEPSVVGFSSTFAQTVPSLTLAKVLKQRNPQLKIVMGGSNCEGPMGAALHRMFPWVDVIVRGEAEHVVPLLFRELVVGKSVTAQSGLCIREGEREEVVAEDRPRVVMQDVPLPAYEEYFERVSQGALKNSKIWLPYETSRGCWWGIKHLCTFCAANGQTVTFRSKPADKVLNEIPELSRRYGINDIWFVDNILDERYMYSLFPRLRDREEKVSIFVETKAHVSKANLETLRDAGVTMAQIGIESLSTSILKLMDKGTTSIQNIRILKWCAELGIKVFWNLIYGFPGESSEEYQRMAELVPSLIHLDAPNPPVRLRLDRFSQYHNDPAKYGIEVAGPLPINRFVYFGDPSDVLDLQYFFTFRYKDGREPDSYVRSFREACALWRREWRENFCRLSYRLEGDTLKIIERRTNREPAIYNFGAVEGKIYLACDSGSTVRRIWDSLTEEERCATSAEGITAFLDEMVRRRVMFEENGVYLSLAVSTERGSQRRMISLPQLDSLSDARMVGQRQERRTRL
jgi:ribosomal peptide maturation radical SAM protein 1